MGEDFKNATTDWLKNIDTMSKQGAKEFFLLVAEMREAQRSYFKTRNQGVLYRCRELEGQVDMLILKGKAALEASRPKEQEMFSGE